MKTKIENNKFIVCCGLVTLAMMLIFVMPSVAQIVVNGNSFIVAPGATVISTGGITIGDSGAIENNGTIQVGGDWTNNGNGLINNGTGVVEFNGTIQQSITGSNGTRFCNLTINNTNDVYIFLPGVQTGSLTGSGSLMFVNGKFIVDSTNMLLTSSCLHPVTGANKDRYIETLHSGNAVLRFDSTCTIATAQIGGVSAYIPITLQTDSTSGEPMDIGFSTGEGLSIIDDPSLPSSLIDKQKMLSQYIAIQRGGPGKLFSYTISFDLNATTNTGNKDKYYVRRYNKATGWITIPSTSGGTIITAGPVPGFNDPRFFQDIFLIGEASGPSDVHQQTEATGFNLDVYPNPAVSMITVKFNVTSARTYSIKLIDLLGRTVVSHEGEATVGTNIYEFDTRSLAKGVYMLSVMRHGETKQMSRVAVVQ